MKAKIVVGGQMDKQDIKLLIEKAGADKVEVEVKQDIEAAVLVKGGQYQYYIGACATGAGGALGIAIGIIGGQHCVSLSIPGRVYNQAEIRQQVQAGKIAFGMVNTDIEKIIPVLVNEIILKEEENHVV